MSERVLSRTAPRRAAVYLGVLIVAVTVMACTEEQRGDLVDQEGAELILEGEATIGDAEPGTLVRGSFVGTVDGEQVFEQDRLGDAC